MQIDWKVASEDARRLQLFISERSNDAFVKNRHRKNIERAREVPSKAAFWKAMIACLLTTQQRSGPESAVARFISKDPFPLEFDQCRLKADLQAHVAAALTSHGGLRRSETIGKEAATNLSTIESSWHKVTQPLLGELVRSDSPKPERSAAREIQAQLRGFGPKQSRNLLQILGLTRYEIPLDSRIIKWVNEFGFPLTLTSAGLSDEDYYSFVMDGIQSLCSAAGVYPCIFDAAVFSSFDKGRWEGVTSIF